MEKRTSKILSEVADYYSAKLAEHGETPRGVDWNGEVSQLIRFEQLSRLIDRPDSFSINDVGCGYGALLDFFTSRYKNFHFNGCDISEAMIQSARRCHQSLANVLFDVADGPVHLADYGIASGIFNVKLKHSDIEWWDYLQQTLDTIDRTSIRGFAFNCLTSYSDQDKMRDYLYYADPCFLFDFCKRRYSRNVALLHDYGLFEFTILVRKQL